MNFNQKSSSSQAKKRKKIPGIKRSPETTQKSIFIHVLIVNRLISPKTVNNRISQCEKCVHIKFKPKINTGGKNEYIN